MQIAIHVEATGLPRHDLPLTHPFQPHVLRFCGVVWDESWNETDRLFTLVKPTSPILMSAEAADHHRDLIEQAKFEGVDPCEVLHWFARNAHGARLIIASDILLDLAVMLILRARLNQREGGS